MAFAAADVRGEVGFPDGNIIPPGTVGRMLVRIINVGPDTVLFAGAGTYYTSNMGFRTFDLFATGATSPCVVVYTDFPLPPPELSTIAASVQVTVNLAAGDSVTCEVGLTTFPESPASFTFQLAFGPLDEDPDRLNNFVFPQVLTGAPPAQVQRPTTIPAGTPWTWLLLGSLVLAAARLRLR
jgi:hypothetical protein